MIVIELLLGLQICMSLIAYLRQRKDMKELISRKVHIKL